MSGGSLNYAFSIVNDTASEVLARAKTPLHRAFAKHISDVAKALHDFEWMLSGDYGPGDEEAAIRAVVMPEMELESALADAKEAAASLLAAIDLCEAKP